MVPRDLNRGMFERIDLEHSIQGHVDDYVAADEMLQWAATALVLLDEKGARDRCPDIVRYAIGRMALFHTQHELDVDLSLPGFFDLCSQPLASWPVRFNPNRRHDLDECLWFDETPTDLCLTEAASHQVAGRGVEAMRDEFDQSIMLDLMNICRSYPEAYSAVRRLVIETPVISGHQLDDFVLNNLSHFPEIYDPLEQLLKNRIYRRIEMDGPLRVCTGCGSHPIIHSRSDCGRAVCIMTGGRQLSSTFQSSGGPVMGVRRGIQKFTVLPGISELNLYERLKSLSQEQHLDFSIELWPHLDRWDLLVTTPDGRCWAADMKDWSSPYKLAKAYDDKPPPVPSNGEVWIVFPDYRIEENNAYVDTFEEVWKWSNHKSVRFGPASFFVQHLTQI